MPNYLATLPRSICIGALAVLLIACQAPVSSDAGPDAGIASTETIKDTAARRPATRMPPVPPADSAAPAIESELDSDNLWDRIRTGLQLHAYYYHPQVSEQLQNYLDNQAFFDLTIERARPFLFTIVEELDARGLPQEIALLPFVESGFNPSANSSEQAVGIWQFMGSTAASLGLQKDWWYDARRDPVASTSAALDYLEELVNQFDQDWLLALAAYNAGDGNVRRAIRRNGNESDTSSSPFWDLALPVETREHVPRVLALARLVANRGSGRIVFTPIANAPPLERVEVGAQIDLAQAARLAQLDYNELRGFNPGYLQWATHPEQPQHILLPPVHAQLLQAGLASMATDQLLTWDHYVIQPGDTLSRIARQLNTRVDVLQRVNNLRGSQIIAGKSLIIPRGDNAETAALAPSTSAIAAIPSSYQIRNGDSLWSIARRFDLHSNDIALWNNLTLDSVLRPGQVIQLHPGTDAHAGETNPEGDVAVTYVVRRGDSMAGIANRFNTSLEGLLERNQLNSSSVIYPGQVIEIRPPQAGTN